MSDSLLRAAKVFVVVAGVLIIGGTATLIAMLVKRGVALPGRAAAEPTAATAVELPPGGEILQASIEAGRLVLLGRMPDGGQFVLVAELATGTRRALIWLTPASP